MITRETLEELIGLEEETSSSDSPWDLDALGGQFGEDQAAELVACPAARTYKRDIKFDLCILRDMLEELKK